MNIHNNAFDIASLIIRHRKNELTETEQAELDKWIAASEKNRALFESLMQEQDKLAADMDFIAKVDVSAAWQKVAQATGNPIQTESKVIPMWQKMAVWRNVAAVVFILGLMGSFFYFSKEDKKAAGTIAAVTTEMPEIVEERAVLLLQDGSRIDLDSLHEGTLSEINGVKMISENGVLKIDASALATKAAKEVVAYNTISTPKGVHYQVVLPDGSKVWLNAASSLKFPAAFTADVRRVELTGEAFFDVVKDKKQFIVHTSDMDVAVLGTTFNVSAYAEDKDIATTLVTGHVQLTGAQVAGTTDLLPGKRAVYTKASRTIAVSTVDPQQYTVWREGKLYFENENLESIMAKLGRWYDFEPQYRHSSSRYKTFTGVAFTNKPLDNLLTMISQTTDVDFEERGNQLIINKK